MLAEDSDTGHSISSMMILHKLLLLLLLPLHVLTAALPLLVHAQSTKLHVAAYDTMP
jgi:hypothetical protein